MVLLLLIANKSGPPVQGFPRLHVWGYPRGELSYLAPVGSENISTPHFKECFFRGGVLPPRLSQTPRLPVPRQKKQIFHFIYWILHQ